MESVSVKIDSARATGEDRIVGEKQQSSHEREARPKEADIHSPAVQAKKVLDKASHK